MCLAIPAKIVGIDEKMATVDVGGVTRRASVVLLPEAAPGDYVLMHAGFAISLVDEDEALETIRLFDELVNGMQGGGAGADL
ncbi:MAG: HypC/HybG/HupF family hydrogenase formation chaperone [Actinobacteria bacterium]|nr:HypC/HybG/HupF family hydrogenase formation chaperone [Actinomycetota bacterium]